ncbi:MAG: hypothetical protein HKM23_03530 [Nitrosopumilus sp.]|nr:hypothetical protein [Nitrosopumilus sp.]
MTRMRTPEQKSRKMLKEEMTLVHLEMAIKKEQFRKSLKIRESSNEISKIDSGHKLTMISSDFVKNRGLLNRLLGKIGF